jgi:hypothetical protein
MHYAAYRDSATANAPGTRCRPLVEQAEAQLAPRGAARGGFAKPIWAKPY